VKGRVSKLRKFVLLPRHFFGPEQGGEKLISRLKARDAAAARKKDKRDAQMADFRSANEERLAERRQKENDTMSM
jgi:hypothetical protein